MTRSCRAPKTRRPRWESLPCRLCSSRRYCRKFNAANVPRRMCRTPGSAILSHSHRAMPQPACPRSQITLTFGPECAHNGPIVWFPGDEQSSKGDEMGMRCGMTQTGAQCRSRPRDCMRRARVGATDLNPILGKDREGDASALTREPGDQPDKGPDGRERREPDGVFRCATGRDGATPLPAVTRHSPC